MVGVRMDNFVGLFVYDLGPGCSDEVKRKWKQVMVVNS